MIGLIHRVSMGDVNMDSKCRRTLPGMRRKCRPAWRSGYLTRIDTNCLCNPQAGHNVQVGISGRGRSGKESGSRCCASPISGKFSGNGGTHDLPRSVSCHSVAKAPSAAGHCTCRGPGPKERRCARAGNRFGAGRSRARQLWSLERLLTAGTIRRILNSCPSRNYISGHRSLGAVRELPRACRRRP